MPAGVRRTDAQAEKLVRAGKRMATALHARWLVVYVETPELLRLPEAERNRVSTCCGWPNLSVPRALRWMGRPHPGYCSSTPEPATSTASWWASRTDRAGAAGCGLRPPVSS